MRHWTVLALLLLIACGPGQAAEPDGLSPAASAPLVIPINIAATWSVRVTEAQRTYIRAWLSAHVHASDLRRVEVTIDNRCHPGLDYRALAVFEPRDAGTHRVRRVVSFQHSSWPGYNPRRGIASGGNSSTANPTTGSTTTPNAPDEGVGGEWSIGDYDTVERIFDLSGERKILPLPDFLSYDRVNLILLAVHGKRIDYTDDCNERTSPALADIEWFLEEEDGAFTIETSDGPDSFSGRSFRCRLQGRRLLIEEVGDWIS